MTTQEAQEDQNIEKPCPHCKRVAPYCVCELITPIKTKTKLLILQHPQEPGVDIGTAPILSAAFPGTIVKTGLSWPNIKKILGDDIDPKRWGVLYLGSVRVEQLPDTGTLFAVDKKGMPLPQSNDVLKSLEGIVILDGTWSQAKTLWWRNAWLLKLPRLVLKPKHRSKYDAIRKEPRTGCLSSVETVGEVMNVLERRDDIQTILERPLEELIARLKKTARPNPRSHGRRDWRRRGRGRSH
jgi:DTW domain-containing protein YfiP